MSFKYLGVWLREMHELTGGCTLEMRADGNADGLCIELSWQQDGRTMSYAHPLSGIELRRGASIDGFSLAQIRLQVDKLIQLKRK
jgi:hypothetical protein